MERHQFSTTINASKEKVWEVLWNIESYKQWTSPFSPESTVETKNWEKGSKVLFLDGKGSGMVAMIDDNKPNEFMSFKHIGQMMEGVEDTTSEKVKEWAGAFENYILKEEDGKTKLIVEIDLDKKWLEYFEKTWPVAMEKIRNMAENN